MAPVDQPVDARNLVENLKNVEGRAFLDVGCQQLAKLKYFRGRTGHLDAVIREDTRSWPCPRLLLVEFAADEGDRIDDAGSKRDGRFRHDFGTRRVGLPR